MGKLVIFGTGPFAEISYYYFSHDSEYEVVAFSVDGDYVEENKGFQGVPVVPFEEVVDRYSPSEHRMFVAMGMQELNRQRSEKTVEARSLGYQLASFLSSKADVAPDLVVHPNTMIMERAGIQPFVSIGANTIIWSGTRIGFHSTIGNNCWVVAATFGESVTLGDNSFVGINATVGPNVVVGSHNIIGAGALVLRNTKEYEVYRGLASRPSRVSSDRVRRI